MVMKESSFGNRRGHGDGNWENTCPHMAFMPRHMDTAQTTITICMIERERERGSGIIAMVMAYFDYMVITYWYMNE